MSEWKTCRLRDLGRIITGKTPPTSSAANFGGAVAFVTPTDMDGRRTIDRTLRTLSATGAGTVKSSVIVGPAIAVSCIGSDMGKAAIVPGQYVSNQQINSIIPNPETDAKFIYYNLFGRRAEIRSLASGAAQPIMNKSSFSDLPIDIPLLVDQQVIGHTLGRLDDKIELNRRMNQTLEAMAQAIFHDWFVDFGPVRRKVAGETDPVAIMGGLTPEPARAAALADLFAGALNADDVPQGWSREKLGDLAKQIAMGPFGSNIKVETFVDSGVPVISGAHLRGLRLNDSGYNFVSQEHARRLGKSNVGRDDVIFTHAGNIGQVSIIPETSLYKNYVISQRQFYMRCNKDLISPFYVLHFFHSPRGRHALLANASQVGVPSIARPATYLRSIEIFKPPKALLAAFDAIVGSFHSKAGANLAESRTLAETRDYLLPRLMSGQVRVTASNTESAAA